MLPEAPQAPKFFEICHTPLHLPPRHTQYSDVPDKHGGGRLLEGCTPGAGAARRARRPARAPPGARRGRAPPGAGAARRGSRPARCTPVAAARHARARRGTPGAARPARHVLLLFWGVVVVVLGCFVIVSLFWGCRAARARRCDRRQRQAGGDRRPQIQSSNNLPPPTNLPPSLTHSHF
jgi:hypothetical protein